MTPEENEKSTNEVTKDNNKNDDIENKGNITCSINTTNLYLITVQICWKISILIFLMRKSFKNILLIHIFRTLTTFYFKQ